MKHNVLVTGGSGMVGRAIQKIVNNNLNNYNDRYNFYFASSSDADLTSYTATQMLFEKLKPKYVIHLAAKVGGLYKNMANKVSMFEDNLNININVVKCCDEFGVERSINALSTCIFPDNIEYPIDETKLHLGPPHPSNEGYAYAKRMLEVQARIYNEKYVKEESNKRMICIIPTNVYGPYDNFHLEDSHVVPGLIHKCYIANETDTIFTFRGTGKPLRQFIFSEDLARMILWCLFDYQPSKTEIDASFVLSPPPESEISIQQLVEIIAKCYDFPEELIYNDPQFSDGQYKKTADNSKFMKHNPNFHFTPIEDGIGQTVQWFLDYYEIARK